MRKINVKKILSEEGKAYRLIEILGRENPNISTVIKVKNLIIWRDTAEEILQGTIDALMFRFEIKASVRGEALRFISKIKGNKPLVIETSLTTRSKENLAIKKALDDNISLIKEMRNARISHLKIHQILGFEFSISKMNQYIQQHISGTK